MYKAHELNSKLYELLKEPLGLQDKCVSFTLKVEFGEAPRVEQSYWVDDKILEQKGQVNE